MKLVQHGRDKFIYRGVSFPKGQPVDLPVDFTQTDLDTLLSWGCQLEGDPMPAPKPVTPHRAPRVPRKAKR